MRLKDRIGGAAYRYSLQDPSLETQGSHTVTFPAGDLGPQPDNATHLIGLIDPDNCIPEKFEDNNETWMFLVTDLLSRFAGLEDARPRRRC